MHELAMCNSIAKAVCENAADRRVRSVHLRIGELRQVIPETLAYCWDLVDRGPLLAGCVLDIDYVPAEVECDSCATRTTLGATVWNCPACGGSAVHVVAGYELTIVSMDVEDG